MDSINTLQNKNKATEEGEDAKALEERRNKTVRTIRNVTNVLMFASAVVGIGSMFIKKKNGLTFGEDALRKTLGDTVPGYLSYSIKKGANVMSGEMPHPDQINNLYRLFGNATGAGEIFSGLTTFILLGDIAATKLYLALTKPNKQSIQPER